jgi:hypothetical protein
MGGAHECVQSEEVRQQYHVRVLASRVEELLLLLELGNHGGLRLGLLLLLVSKGNIVLVKLTLLLLGSSEGLLLTTSAG